MEIFLWIIGIIVAVPALFFICMFCMFFAGAWVNRPSARYKNRK